MRPALATLPVPVLVVLAVAAVVQLALQVTALVVLARTPRERLQLGAHWPWVLLILLVNLVGAVVFLAAGRLPAPVGAAEPAPAVGDPVRRAVDTLYGPRP